MVDSHETLIHRVSNDVKKYSPVIFMFGYNNRHTVFLKKDMQITKSDYFPHSTLIYPVVDDYPSSVLQIPRTLLYTIGVKTKPAISSQDVMIVTDIQHVAAARTHKRLRFNYFIIAQSY